MVSDFSAPISKSVRIVGCGRHTRTYVLLGCPANVLGDGAPASLADPGHALPSLLPPPAAVGSRPSGNPEGYLRLATQAEKKKKAIPIGMTFSFLVAEAGLEPTTSGL